MICFDDMLRHSFPISQTAQHESPLPCPMSHVPCPIEIARFWGRGGHGFQWFPMLPVMDEIPEQPGHFDQGLNEFGGQELRIIALL